MPPYLIGKDNTYYFRQAVPAELRAILGKRYAVEADGLIADARSQFDNRLPL